MPWASQNDLRNILFHTETSQKSSGDRLMWVPIRLVLIAWACMPEGVTPIGPIRSTPPDTKSEPDSCRVCSMISQEWLGSMSSASTKAQELPGGLLDAPVAGVAGPSVRVPGSG